MAREIKNVALAGASGNVGSNILKALVESHKFNITVLVRKDGSSFPIGVTAKVVDFDSSESLTDAVKGQDAVIDATLIPDAQVSIRLMDAAAAAGVYRFIPSEFSADPSNVKTRSLPVFQGKTHAYEHIQKLAKESRMTFTTLSTGAFLDWSLRTSFINIDLANKSVDLLNDGSNVAPWTTLEIVGKATVNILLQPEETKNQSCYIYSVYKSQKEIAEMAKEALGAEGWKTRSLDMEKVFEDAMAELKAGNVTLKVIGDIIRYACSRSDYIKPWEKDDNKLLGVNTMTDNEVKQLIKQIAEKTG